MVGKFRYNAHTSHPHYITQCTPTFSSQSWRELLDSSIVDVLKRHLQRGQLAQAGMIWSRHMVGGSGMNPTFTVGPLCSLILLPSSVVTLLWLCLLLFLTALHLISWGRGFYHTTSNSSLSIPLMSLYVTYLLPSYPHFVLCQRPFLEWTEMRTRLLELFEPVCGNIPLFGC